MTFIRDCDTSEDLAAKVLSTLGFEDKPIVLDSFTSPLKEVDDDTVIFITSMPFGFLKYHSSFFDHHKTSVGRWSVILINDDKVTYNQLKIELSVVDSVVNIYVWNQIKDNRQIVDEIGSSLKINSKKVLIYSIRSCCGKRTLSKLLSQGLTDWELYVAEENHTCDYIAQTDARYIVIVGKTMEDFKVDIPEGRNPVYVLTMPDENVQAYLKKDELSQVLVNIVPEHLGWTSAQAQKYFFFISPLYELWRINGVDPVLDNNFVMWDEYGLPMLHSEYTPDNIKSFLGQFNQAEALIGLLKTK